MFTGIGGFELGIQYANRSPVRGSKENTSGDEGQGLLSTTGKDTSSLDGRSSERPDNFSDERPLCVGYSEIDKYADATYQQHFGGHTNYGDATKINAGELPDFDLLVGGFPCQAFSVAGKRAGFNDTRGTLFFDIARICAEKRPRHMVLENVKGLLSHDSGKTFQTIIGVLTDLGYFVEWQVLNSKDFGVPQNRERVFIVGHLGDGSGRKVFPITSSSRTHNQKLERYATGTIKTRAGDTQNDNTFVATDTESPRIRRLTPLECERLQGFPDGWTLGSDSQRYKQCGNAITVNVVEHVVRSLYAKTNND